MSGASLLPIATFRVGSFNIGINQEMLNAKRTPQYLDDTERIIQTCVTEYRLQVMNLCELGGHRQGLEAANINPLDMNIFRGTAAASVSVDSNYLTAWGFNVDTPQFDVRATCPSKVFGLFSQVCQPELIVHVFENGIGVRLIVGNLHIRIPHEKKVSTSQKQTIVKQALVQLENEASLDGATQPVALLLVGDCNLVKETAEEATQALQPVDDNFLTVWHVHRTEAGKGGDVMFVKGAHCKPFVFPFGVHTQTVVLGTTNTTPWVLSCEFRPC